MVTQPSAVAGTELRTDVIQAKALQRIALMLEYQMLMAWHPDAWVRDRLDVIELCLWGDNRPTKP